MKISIIIPSYKPKDYLWECLHSLTIQDFPKEEFEILIILNGCGEPYFSSIEKFVADEMKGHNVSIHQTEQSGVSNARNIGIEKAVGTWIAFIDDDDRVSPSYLKELYKVSSHDTISVSNVKCFHESNGALFDDYLSKSYQNNQGKDNIRLLNIRSFMSTCCCKLIPTHLIGKQKFNTKFTHSEDALFMFLISNKVKQFAMANPDTVYFRRVRTGSASRSTTKLFSLKNKIRVVFQFSRIYFSSPFQYNFWFFLTRIAAVLLK